MGISLVAGRGFQAGDGPGDPAVVVVSELFAQRYFPGASAIGQTVMMSTDTRLEGGRVVAGGEKALTIVGVVSDVRQLTLVMEPDPMVYLPLSQTTARDPIVVLRTRGQPAEILEAARAEVRALDPNLLVSRADVLQRSMEQLIAPLSVRTALILALAALAAFLTAVGIYGVVAYVVSDQVHEIGVRIALGARSAGEAGRVIAQALAPVTAGACLGLVGAWAASGLVRAELFGVEPLDPITYGGVMALLISVAALAAWLPARRAAAVDPIRVLKQE
jgi:ABC-type antimicrobial peptide transport system permease subunit